MRFFIMTSNLKHELFKNYDNITDVTYLYHSHEKEIRAHVKYKNNRITKVIDIVHINLGDGNHYYRQHAIKIGKLSILGGVYKKLKYRMFDHEEKIKLSDLKRYPDDVPDICGHDDSFCAHDVIYINDNCLFINHGYGIYVNLDTPNDSSNSNKEVKSLLLQVAELIKAKLDPLTSHEINALANMDLPDVTKMTIKDILDYTKRDQ